MNELVALIGDKAKRLRGRDLLDSIRWKTLAAEKAHESRLIAQYVFEEACAKAFIFEKRFR